MRMLVTLILARLAATVLAVDAKSLRVCVLSGCNTYDSEVSLPPLQEVRAKRYNVQCTRLVRQADDDLPGLEKLDDYDVALASIKRMRFQRDHLARLKKYVTSGRPDVTERTASHVVQAWLDFDREALDGNYHGSFPVGRVTRIKTVAGAEKRPVLAGATLTESADSRYKNVDCAVDTRLLPHGAIPGQAPEALAWTRDYKGGRIYDTSLGALVTFQDANFRRMSANVLFWTARREVETKL